MYDNNSVLVVGHGRTSSDNAITKNFQMFYISFVIDVRTDEVIDLQSTTTLDVTDKFIKGLFVGKKFNKLDSTIEKDIQERYFGTSQRAIEIAYKDALKKYEEAKAKYY